MHNVVFSKTTNKQTNSSPHVHRPLPFVRVQLKMIMNWLSEKKSTLLLTYLLYQCGPGSIAGIAFIRGLSFLLVLVLAPRVFPRVLRCFLPPQKPTLLNSNLIGNLSATGLLAAKLLCSTLVKESHLFIYFSFNTQIE